MTPRALPVVLVLLAAPASAHSQSAVELLHETFDALVPPSLPPGWVSSRNRSPGVDDFTSTSSVPRSSPNALVSTNATMGQEVRTPVLDFTSAVPESLRFAVRRSSSHAARVVVEVSTDGGATFPWCAGDTLRAEVTTSYAVHAAVLPALLAGCTTAVIRWRVIPDPSGSTGTFRLDDITITGNRLDDMLLLRALLTPAHPVGDEAVAVAVTVRNAGRRPAGAFSVGVFLDGDADSSADPAELLGTWTGAAGIPPGDSAAGEVAAGALPPGRRLLVVRLDAPADEDTTNNIILLPCVVSTGEGTVVVNEIMYAPAGSEPEWVEILNTAADTMDLGGWTIADNTAGPGHLISGAARLLPPGAFAVLARDSAALYAIRPSMPHVVIPVSGFPALNNTGDAVVLRDAGSLTVDSVSYLPAWGGAGGASLERVDPLAEANNSSNWETSAGGGTATPGDPNSVVMLDDDVELLTFRDQSFLPAQAALVLATVRNRGRNATGTYTVRLYQDVNRDSVAAGQELVAESPHAPVPASRDSEAVIIPWEHPSPGTHGMIAVVYDVADGRRRNDTAVAVACVGFPPGTVVINEVMAQPRAGSAEYLELCNPGSAAVACGGWTLRGMAGETAFSLPESLVLGPGEFLLVAADSSIVTAFPAVAELDAGHVEFLDASLSLNGDGDRVVIAGPAGEAVDSVSYSDSWHNPDVTDHTGRSLERIHPTGGSNDPRNWSSSAAYEGGTPGGANSIFTPVAHTAAALTVAPNPFSPDGDAYEDFTAIGYRLPAEVSVVRLRIYDVRGRLVRMLLNSEPAGAQGTVVWDGRDDERRNVRMGIYILLLEALDRRGGTVMTARATVVVATRL
jgi:hypothetical protein